MEDGPLLPNEAPGLSRDFTLLPELLKDEGYSTVGLGKWHLGFTHVADLPSNRGFDKFFGNLQGAGDFFLHEVGMMCNSANPVNPDQHHPTHGSNCYAVNGYDLNYNGEPVLADESGELYRGQYYTDVLATKATQFIEEHDTESPLFMYLAPTAPHAPMQATPELLALCDHITTDNYRNILCAMMAGVDSMVGDVLAALKAKDMLEDTVIAFVSDNGGVSFFGSENLFKGDKGSVFEGGVRVPAFITGNIKKSLVGTSYDGLVHANDIFATLARAGNVDESIIAASDGHPILHKEMHKYDKDFERDVVFLGLSGPLYGSSGGVVFKHNSHYYKWSHFPAGFSYIAGYSNEFIRGVTDGDFSLT
jgi:arylsulfatase A-like enzyme